MPRLPIDYSNTMFYKIVSANVEVDDIYVGHTTDFKPRKAEHKRRCNSDNHKYHNCYVYKFIRSHGGWTNFDMVLIEQRSCINKLEAEQIERFYIETLYATLNKVIPTRTDKEYKTENKIEISQKAKQYRETNKHEISEKRKLHRQEHKDEYAARSKSYYELNKEKILIKQKERNSKKKQTNKIKTENNNIENENVS